MFASASLRTAKHIAFSPNINNAFVHCWVLPGGALKVLKDLIKNEKNRSPDVASWIMKNSLLFTLTSDRESLYIEGIGEIKIITALPKWLNKLFQYSSFHRMPVISFFCDYRNLMLFYPVLMRVLSRKIRRYQPKNIVISSFAVAKNLEMCKSPSSPHYNSENPHKKLYLHSPMQYVRSHYDDYLKKLSGLKLRLFKKISKRLRKRDKKFTCYDKVVANSKYTAKLAEEIYDIKNSTVKYPEVDPLFFQQSVNTEPHNYYLYAGRLTKLVKEVDVLIDLFNKAGLPLLIMGSGPDEEELQKMAEETIIFLGRIDDAQERINIIKNAKWFINLTKESFGLSNAESLLLGVPIFGLDDGATPELVDEDSGVLVKKEEFWQLNEKIKTFSEHDRNREKISERAQKLLK